MSKEAADLLRAIRDVAEMEGARPRLEAALPHVQDFFSRMADHHLIHGDLTGSNVILDEESRPTFIDLDGSLYLRLASRFRRHRRRDLDGFMKNWRSNPMAAKVFRSLVDPS